MTNIIALKTRKPKKSATKSRLSPRSAKKVAAKPADGAHKAPAKRPTRGDEVFAMLRRKNGATVGEMVARFGLQPHSLRAIISVESRKRGLKVELVGRAHYRAVR